MKLLLDENIPVEVKKVLSRVKHDVEHINYVNKSYNDLQVWEYAIKTKRTLVTFDADFCKFRKEEHYGLIKISAKLPNPEIIILNLLNYLKEKNIELENTYFQIDAHKAFYELKKYSKKRHLFKQYQNIPIDIQLLLV